MVLAFCLWPLGRAFYARVMLPFGGLVTSQVAADRVRERAAEVLGRGEYQRELPRPVAPFTLDLPGLGPLGKLLTVLAWAALVVVVALLAAWVIQRLRGWDRDARLNGAGPTPGAPAEIHVAAAQALATEGRYGDAIHALLLETLQALSRAARLPRSFTSREIVARVPLGRDSREALAGLVAAVEVSWFGGAVPSEADYLGCLAQFHVFLASYRRTA
jgi:hypothetical protein